MSPVAAPGVRSDSVYSEIAIVEMGSWRVEYKLKEICEEKTTHNSRNVVKIVDASILTTHRSFSDTRITCHPWCSNESIPIQHSSRSGKVDSQSCNDPRSGSSTDNERSQQQRKGIASKMENERCI